VVDSSSRLRFANRAHFFAVAAEAMRRILVEAARRKKRLKHGGDYKRVDLDLIPMMSSDDPAVDVEAISDALDALENEDADKATLVKMRYFAGLTLEDSAAALGISLATAKRRWTVARAWLYDRLSNNDP
jgi:RNA polymerase sigma factor (TIGR02999 family)